ncbi:DUF2017 family protein [Glaciibacter flavus]|uniref:DUF2017 family protein n=1 Tax=Orlajensenia flava TaxID=2565934 RepID=UPI003B00E35F
MTAVEVTDAGRVQLTLEPDEARMLADLAEQIEQLVTEAVDDPAFDRLFPPAYRDDAAASAEFERFERAGLAEGKAGAARTVMSGASGGDLAEGEPVRIELDDHEIWAWMTHLTDVRLVLAERLGIDDDDGGFELDDEMATLVPLYDWLGWLQAALVDALESTTEGA